MFSYLLRLLRTNLRRLPSPIKERVYELMKPTGLAYCLSYFADFQKAHDARNFAGNVLGLHDKYQRGDINQKEELSRQFATIVDYLVLKNGVRKTTDSGRQNVILAALFSDNKFRLRSGTIKVLDLPSSIGIACLDTYSMLATQYKISSYVMGDLYFHVLYDKARECVFDESGNLLQVKLKKRFYSVYKPQGSGDVYGFFARCVLAPLDLVSWYMRRRYQFADDKDMIRLLLMHPEVEARLAEGVFGLETLDAFKEIRGEYDLILSFNLLQKSYFSEDQIRVGVMNLQNALCEDGLLVMGNDESFSVSKKAGGELLLLHKSGDF